MIYAVKDWLSLVPPAAVLAGLGYTFYLAYCPAARPKCTNMCNQKIRKSENKVVDILEIEDIAEKAAFCRCWRSKNVSISVICSNCTIINCLGLRRFLQYSIWLLFNNDYYCSGLIVMAAMANTTKWPGIMLVRLWWNIVVSNKDKDTSWSSSASSRSTSYYYGLLKSCPLNV